MEQIEDLNDILAKDERVCTIVKQDLTEIKEDVYKRQLWELWRNRKPKYCLI